MVTFLRGAIGKLLSTFGNLALVAGLVLGVFAVCVGLTVGAAWTFTAIDGWVHPSHHPRPSEEVCWIRPGPNGLQSVRGVRSDMPTDSLKAYEIPCN